jgi:hypothetical protein
MDAEGSYAQRHKDGTGAEIYRFESKPRHSPITQAIESFESFKSRRWGPFPSFNQAITQF